MYLDPPSKLTPEALQRTFGGVCRPVEVSKTGYVTIQVEVSLSDTFQDAVTETARVRSIPGTHAYFLSCGSRTMPYRQKELLFLGVILG